MATAVFKIELQRFERQALQWAQQFDEICFLQSNGYRDAYSKIEGLLAVQAFDCFVNGAKDSFLALEEFRAKHPHRWMFGFFSYDLKNELAGISSNNCDRLGFPEAYFFVPNILLHFGNGTVKIEAPDPELIYRNILATPIQNDEAETKPVGVRFKKRMSKKKYIEVFEHLLAHIRRGDIYEVNLCQEFYAEKIALSPLTVYQQLNRVSPTPFSCFFKTKEHFVLSASPERFLAKRENTVISQPIKGTAGRGKTKEEDQCIIQALRTNPKEISENVMIVDLVRNDLTRSAQKGSVNVEKQLEVQTFQQVHQLVSTISCQKKTDLSDVQAIRNTFPAGSMTGAPKISAMKLCESYENSKRGVYSGALGYFDPQGDFDFSVVIRSLLYNSRQQYLSFHTGGAITIGAEAAKEYDECLLKASGILKALLGSLVD